MNDKNLTYQGEAAALPDEKSDMRNTATLANADLAAQHRTFLAATASDNTRRAYRSAIRHFLAWGGTSRSDNALMIRYLPAYAESLNSRTPGLRLTALSQWHLHQGFADPASTPTVRKILRRHCADKRQAEEEGQGAADRGSGAHSAVGWPLGILKRTRLRSQQFPAFFISSSGIFD